MVTQILLLTRLALSTIGVIVLVYAAVRICLWSQKRALIFVPEPVVRHTPTEFGLRYLEVTVPLGDSDALHGWWLPSRRAPLTPIAVCQCAAPLWKLDWIPYPLA